MNSGNKLLNGYKSFKPFTNDEAWTLFKLAAIFEAFGWTLLITGIIFSRYIIPGNQIPVQLAGRTHGTLFLIYIVAVLVLSPSLKWSERRTLIAGLCSVPPYGSLLFEIWASHNRKKVRLNNLMGSLCYKSVLANYKNTEFLKPAILSLGTE